MTRVQAASAWIQRQPAWVWFLGDGSGRRLRVVIKGLVLSALFASLGACLLKAALQASIDQEIDEQVAAVGTATPVLDHLSNDQRHQLLRPYSEHWAGPSPTWFLGGKKANPYRSLTAQAVFKDAMGLLAGELEGENLKTFKLNERGLSSLVQGCYDSVPYVLFRMFASCTYVHMQFITWFLFMWGVVHVYALSRNNSSWRLDSLRQEYPQELVLNFLLKVVPLTGFIGTVISMPEAIDKAHALVGAKELHEPFKQVTSALAAKFDTTFVGLSFTVFLFFVVDFFGEGSRTETTHRDESTHDREAAASAARSEGDLTRPAAIAPSHDPAPAVLSPASQPTPADASQPADAPIRRGVDPGLEGIASGLARAADALSALAAAHDGAAVKQHEAAARQEKAASSQEAAAKAQLEAGHTNVRTADAQGGTIRDQLTAAGAQQAAAQAQQKAATRIAEALDAHRQRHAPLSGRDLVMRIAFCVLASLIAHATLDCSPWVVVVFAVQVIALHGINTMNLEWGRLVLGFVAALLAAGLSLAFHGSLPRKLAEPWEREVWTSVGAALMPWLGTWFGVTFSHLWRSTTPRRRVVASVIATLVLDVLLFVVVAQSGKPLSDVASTTFQVGCTWLLLLLVTYALPVYIEGDQPHRPTT